MNTPSKIEMVKAVLFSQRHTLVAIAIAAPILMIKDCTQDRANTLSKTVEAETSSIQYEQPDTNQNRL